MPELTEADYAELKERARRGGIKSGETRRAKAKVRADLRARQLFVEDAEALAQEMLDAAHGRGKFSTLDPKERAALLKTCLEYAVGRPRPQDPLARDDEDTDSPKSGFAFGVAEGNDEGDSAQPGEPGPLRPEPA
jgi:hypothetical protein